MGETKCIMGEHQSYNARIKKEMKLLYYVCAEAYFSLLFLYLPAYRHVPTLFDMTKGKRCLSIRRKIVLIEWREKERGRPLSLPWLTSCTK